MRRVAPEGRAAARLRPVVAGLLAAVTVVMAVTVPGRASAAVRGHTVLAAVPAAPGPLLWSDPLPIDTQPLTGIACPSTTLCVAIDRAGGVRWTTDPLGRPRRWAGADVDLAEELTGLACPSISLCVASDAAGDVVTSSDPTGGAAAWSVAAVDPNVGAVDTDSGGVVLLHGITCPSASLCVAVDSVGDDVVSTDPTGGAGSWVLNDIDTGRTRGCTVTGLACQSPLEAVACPSVSLCAAVDEAGDLLTTGSPLAPGGWNVTATPDAVGQLWALACPTTGLCEAPDGAGGRVVQFDPADPTAFLSRTLPDDAYGIWCPDAGLCLGNAESRSDTLGLLGSTDPAARHPHWALGPPGDVTGVACPSASVCLAADGEGNVSVGESAAAVDAALRADLLDAHPGTRRALATAGALPLAFPTAITGEVQLTWDSVPRAGANGGGAAAAVRVATATHTFTAPGTAHLRLQLTPAGRRLLRAKASPSIAETATFATGVGSLTVRRTVTLR